EKGLRVPDDVSVVGFDDIPEAEHFAPPLTTLRQDFQLLGHDMLTALLARINGDEHPQIAPQQPALVVRASTADVARRTLLTSATRRD
ncbi:MAG: substrate-binding domain-containing protein, partial [Herbiconiux sp.]|nr:substrate-binding domain-containing protein [Herbiconiux sp.]